MELNLATSEELIEELLSRSTFVGAVIRSEDEHTRDGQIHSNFKFSTTVPTECLPKFFEIVTGILERM